MSGFVTSVRLFAPFLLSLSFYARVYVCLLVDPDRVFDHIAWEIHSMRIKLKRWTKQKAMTEEKKNSK